MAAVNNIVLTTEAEALEKILSPFIQEQFPSFMQTDYRKLVLFIKAYYEWMEQKGNAGYVLSKLDTIWDSDRSLDEFYSHFKNTYLLSFPELFAVNADGKTPNKNLLLKKIRDFYGNKGTESAYKFLFRLLYDSDLEFYYPKNDILKVSDGVWEEPRSIKTTSNNGVNLFSGKNGQIFQYSGSTVVASAFIDSVLQYSSNGLPITEFFITDIIGNFIPNQSVKIIKDSIEFTEVSYSVLGDFYVETPGSGYRIGEIITVTTSAGVGFSAKIDQIGLAGSIKRIGISNSGLNYTGDVVVDIVSENGQQSAIVVARNTAVTNYPGYFSSNRGKLSSNKKIQDGHYYQEFSYELKSDVSIGIYFDVLKKLVHPAGMRMFGSILVKKSLDNALTSSDQATYFEIPVIGKYTPYRLGTTLDLRANGVTSSGYWLGATGDLYPLVYNPYIGSTSEVGPNGKTTSVGTVFVGTSLGYTYCYVPEGGRTAHNPIGAPLGSTSAWFRQKENAWTPQGLNGLVLWLKPENIGVCGSVVNGASMDVWRDASPSGNDAVPPTWDRWNSVMTSTLLTSPGGGWSKEVYSTTPITRVQFKFSGVCGGFRKGRIFMAGLNSDPESSPGYTTLDYAIYGFGPYGANPTISRNAVNFESGITSVILKDTQTNYSGLDETVFEIEYAEPNIIYRVDGVEGRRTYAGYGNTYYFDSTFFTDVAYPTEIGHSLTVLGMWNGQNTVVPTGVTSSTGISTVVYAGVTIDKLRPTLVINDNGVAGATGIAFNAGTLYSPWTRWTESGKTLGGVGITFGPGTTGEKINTAQHFYLKNGLTLSADMDLFIVFRVIDGSSNHNYGFVGSNRNANDIFFTNREDSVIHCRSWNTTDRTLAAQNSSSSYVIDGNQKRYYSSTSAFLFRPWGAYDVTTVPEVQRQSIGYDPHVSGPSMGIIIGEAARDTQNTLYAWYNGDRARNYSPSTGMRIANDYVGTYPYLALSETPVCGVTVGIGRFGGYIKTQASITDTTAGSAAWVYGATSGYYYGFRGVINEVIVFNRKLQETERQEVYGYLARKYSMDTKLPNSYTRSHPSAYALGLTYWNIEHHPNTKPLKGFYPGLCFGNIKLATFFEMPDFMYKSIGTIQSDQSLTVVDTYNSIGQ